MPGVFLHGAACVNPAAAIEDIFKGHSEFVPAYIPLSGSRVSHKNSVSCSVSSLILFDQEKGWIAQWFLESVGPVVCRADT